MEGQRGQRGPPRPTAPAGPAVPPPRAPASRPRRPVLTGPRSHLAPSKPTAEAARSGKWRRWGRGARATFPGGPRQAPSGPTTAESGARPCSPKRGSPGPAHRASPPLPPGRAASDGRSLLDRERGQTPSHLSVAPHWLSRLRRWCEGEAIGPGPRQLRRREPRLPPATPFGLEGRGPEKTRAWREPTPPSRGGAPTRSPDSPPRNPKPPRYLQAAI